jgi:putative oxidoreductase
MLESVQYGFGYGDVALTINRVLVGLFFAVAGYHKLFNAERHAMLVEAFKGLKIPAIGFNQWWVPTVEFMGGLALISGVLAPLAAQGLLVICVVAACTYGRKVLKQKRPIDVGDKLNNVLYLPETLLALMLVVVTMEGPGPFTIPALIGIG